MFLYSLSICDVVVVVVDDDDDDMMMTFSLFDISSRFVLYNNVLTTQYLIND